MGFELGRANRCNRFDSILREMRGSATDAQDVRVENPRAVGKASVRVPTIPPFEGLPVDTPRRGVLPLVIVGAIVYFAVMAG